MFEPALVSEIVVDARVPATCSSHAGVVGPMPKLNAVLDLSVVEVATNDPSHNGCDDVAPYRPFTAS